MEIRTNQGTGRLLFKWDPDHNVISIVCKNKLYDVQLSTQHERYEVKEIRDPPREPPSYQCSKKINKRNH